MHNIEALDVLAVAVIVVAVLITAGAVWMWGLYFGPDNPAPRSRFLGVLCFSGTLIMVAEWPLAALAAYRLADGPSLGTTGGLILAACVLVLGVAFLLIIGYLFWLRRSRSKTGKRGSPPPFSPED